MSKEKDYVLGLTENKYDPALGREVQMHLEKLGLENPTVRDGYTPQDAFEHIQVGIYNGLRDLGLNMQDESMRETPRRYAAMVVGELTRGLNYDFFPKCTVTPNGYNKEVTGEFQSTVKGAQDFVRAGAYDEMVLEKDIQVMSLCEHHLQTIDGVCHVAYLPKEKLLGLSKFARVVEFFCRRPQVQERLTAQVSAALQYILGTDDVAVLIDATHYCMKARGAMQANCSTQTNQMNGRFRSNQALREEFLCGLKCRR